MNTLTLDGYWYSDALPGGRFVSAKFGGGVVMPPGMLSDRDLQWLRISPDGTRCAGTGSNDDHAWEWDGASWQDRGAFKAPRAVIYQPDGSLKVERDAAWPGPGSQGWRYVDDAGEVVPSWQTYADRNRQIYEYTTRRDVTIGQGGSGGVEALIPGKRIRLDRLIPGLGDAPNCNDVNFNRVGDDYAVSWYVAHSPVKYTACFVWLTDAELRALPDASVVDPPPPPPPPPPPEEPPAVPNLLSTVQKIRAKYPTPLGARHWEFLVELAQATGAQLFRKEAGDNVLIPPLGKRVSMDVIGRGTLGDVWVDVLGDAEGAAVPAWDAHPNAAGEYVDVSGIVLPGAPEPTPPPPPPTTTLEARVKVLEDLVLEMAAESETAFAKDEARLDALDARLNSLPAPAIDLDALAAALEVAGKTASSFGHQHAVKLAVTRKK